MNSTERVRIWRSKNPSKHQEYCRQYYLDHKVERKEYNKSREGIRQERRWKIKLQMIERLGGRCVRCGETDPRVLEINHINGGGGKERHLAKAVLIVQGKRKTEDLDLRCANCNLIYEFEQGRRYPCLPELRRN